MRYQIKPYITKLFANVYDVLIMYYYSIPSTRVDDL